jgi:TRAP-type C4-dicarboxylate transport system permease large subunit
VAAAEIMASIGIALGFVALIVPGIVLSLRWAVVAQAAALEDNGWLTSLRSSRRLTATHYEHVFTLLLLTSILSFAVLLGARTIPLGSTSSAASVTVGIAVETLIASFTALTLALLYFDLRARLDAPQRPELEYPHLHDLDQHQPESNHP